MKIHLSILAIVATFCNVVFAQNIDVKWSEQQVYDNKEDGFFNYFVGGNSSYVYAKFSNYSALSTKKANKKIKIVAFDKNTMNKVADVELKGYTKNEKLDNLDYERSVIFDNVIYVFWTNKDKGASSREIYVQSFDAKLKKLGKLNKIYEFAYDKKGANKNSFFILTNKAISDKLMIGRELPIENGQNVKVEYKLVGSDFSFISSKQVTLPVIINITKKGLFGRSTTNGLKCNYEFGEDGNLYADDIISMDKDEAERLPKAEAKTYRLVMQINSMSGSVKSYSLKFPKKNTFNFNYVISGKDVKMYGFFSDLEKDVKGKDTHGIFYVKLDNSTFQSTDMNFAYFKKDFLDKLYNKDNEDQKKGKGLFKSKKDKASDDESIDDNYVIESIQKTNGDLVLFCTIMRNWSNTVCSSNPNGGGTTCRTYYYCDKSNVTAFKLNSEGDIVWAQNMDRFMRYSGWYIHDVNVVRNADKFIVTYGSAYQMNAEKKNRKSRKSSKQYKDRLEYATFNSSDGSYVKSEYQVNKINASKKEKKFLDPSSISVIDNRMYFDYSKIGYKTGWVIGGCFAMVCPLTYFFTFANGNAFKGKGNLGTIIAK